MLSPKQQTHYMKNNSLLELSIQDLIKRRDLLKGVLIGFSILWLLILGMMVYFLINKSSTKTLIPFAILPTALPVTILPVYIYMNTLNNKIKLREKK
ncbi:hypothetical protein [Mucilaginibacter terrae]|nr:hypothetical protein [Mucilaginibacter terrae]